MDTVQVGSQGGLGLAYDAGTGCCRSLPIRAGSGLGEDNESRVQIFYEEDGHGMMPFNFVTHSHSTTANRR